MQIPYRDFLSLVPDAPLFQTLNRRTTYALILKHFCKSKTTSGTCPTICSMCQFELNDCVTSPFPNDKKSKSGMFIFRLRNKAQKSKETDHIAIIETDVWGQETEASGWDELMAEYEEGMLI